MREEEEEEDFCFITNGRAFGLSPRKSENFCVGWMEDVSGEEEEDDDDDDVEEEEENDGSEEGVGRRGAGGEALCVSVCVSDTEWIVEEDEEDDDDVELSGRAVEEEGNISFFSVSLSLSCWGVGCDSVSFVDPVCSCVCFSFSSSIGI